MGLGMEKETGWKSAGNHLPKFQGFIFKSTADAALGVGSQETVRTNCIIDQIKVLKKIKK
jgi:hypothetical protein